MKEHAQDRTETSTWQSTWKRDCWSEGLKWPPSLPGLQGSCDIWGYRPSSTRAVCAHTGDCAGLCVLYSRRVTQELCPTGPFRGSGESTLRVQRWALTSENASQSCFGEKSDSQLLNKK